MEATRPQAVLTKIKNKLNYILITRLKVTQDGPCVTITLSKINFDVLPSLNKT
jgi:hypothetical protein